MRIIQAHKHYSDAEADERFPGTLLMDSDYDIVVGDEDTTVLKENGEPLLIYRKGVLPLSQCKQAFAGLREATKQGSSNRGMAQGKGKIVGADIGDVSESRIRPRKADGSLSNTYYALNSDMTAKLLNQHGGKMMLQQSDGSYIESEPVNAKDGIVGYVDGNPRFPYCRLTAFNLNQPDQFNDALPLIRTVDRVFGDTIPERYAAQRDVVARTTEDFYISGTVFTTLTVNLSFRTACHKDAGDLKEGFGVMSALRKGCYDGCYTCFPQYRVAANMQTGDVLLADVHEWHGNTPIHARGRYERLSLIFYYRENIQHCGTAEQELEKAKREKGTTHLKDWGHTE